MIQKLKEVIFLTAEYYNQPIRPEVILMFVEDFSGYRVEEVIKAYSQYRKNPKNTKAPLPAQIIALMNPEIDSKEIAIELSRKIDRVISKFGWNWQEGVFINGNIYFEGGGKYHWTFEEAVKAELGEVGLHIVNSRGWTHLRNSANSMPEGTFIAQLREQIQSSVSLAKQGVDLTKLEFSKNDSEKIEFKNQNQELQKLLKGREIES